MEIENSWKMQDEMLGFVIEYCSIQQELEAKHIIMCY